MGNSRKFANLLIPPGSVANHHLEAFPLYRNNFYGTPISGNVNKKIRYTGKSCYTVVGAFFVFFFNWGELAMTTRLGEKIHVLRKAKNLTLEGLAKTAGISKSYLWELENREAPSPSYEKLVGLADQLGVTINYLIEDDQRTSEEQHRDENFYRGYQNLKPDDKERLRKILDTFKDQ